MATLACMVLHNVCLEKKEQLPSSLDVSIDPSTQRRRDRATIRDLLLMRVSKKKIDLQNNEANKIRLAITNKLQKEHESITK
eukprot:gene12533-13819_t